MEYPTERKENQNDVLHGSLVFREEQLPYSVLKAFVHTVVSPRAFLLTPLGLFLPHCASFLPFVPSS